MLVDLNVSWPQKDFKTPISKGDEELLKATLMTLKTLGYTHVALNFTVSHMEKFPNNVKEMNPMNINERFKELMEHTGLKIYSRITLVIDDPSKGQSVAKISQAYDIVAAQPVSEKGLTLATTNLDIDILTFNYQQRLPTMLKHKTICSCVNKGIKVEIVYGAALRDSQSRKQFISNARSVIRSSRGRGIVISSGALQPTECRNILGATSIVGFLGLKSDSCSRAMGELASLVLLNGRLRRKSYKQVIAVGSENVVDSVSSDDSRNVKIVRRMNGEEPTTKRVKS
ncbi:Ribonuclease P/MRP protein subunit RPP1 [Nakaseomyces bracarensis]|uniref:Ribonuclease P/MRP protein subunit RPP1 n=1 Tax=Nakaseomyces bracarensis TaxID=273131 RepID=A0ABR4P058_9SACH